MTQIAVTSPCTGICKLDATTGWCVGCGRSGPEIADWSAGPLDWRDAVWSAIPERLADLGVACRRLPWTTRDIQAFVRRSFQERSGAWSMGVVGALAAFDPAAGEAVTVSGSEAEILARTRGGAARMRVDEDVRALSFDPPGAAARIVLAVKRERGRPPLANAVRDLGEDAGALIEGADTRLFDLGLGRKEARFCVRVAPGRAHAALSSAEGQPFAQALRHIGSALIVESPTRVVETALGRIEIEGRIPAPGTRAPDGPHTHLLPDHLATGRALPVGMDLPRAYLPGAIFYPRA